MPFQLQKEENACSLFNYYSSRLFWHFASFGKQTNTVCVRAKLRLLTIPYLNGRFGHN